MAHPCFECGGECYCHGDIDDVIVSKTPPNCEGCGCKGWLNEDELDDDEEDELIENRYKKLGTPVTIGELKKLINGYDDHVSFGFKNQPVQSLFEIRYGETVFVVFQ